MVHWEGEALRLDDEPHYRMEATFEDGEQTQQHLMQLRHLTHIPLTGHTPRLEFLMLHTLHQHHRRFYELSVPLGGNRLHAEGHRSH